MPRQSHKPTPDERRLVERAASIGIQQNVIADIIGISEPTLRRHYRSELDHAGVRANVAVADRLFQTATGDGPKSTTAAIFWLKCRAGWRENAEPEALNAAEIGQAMADALIEMDRVTAGEGYDPVASAKRRMEERERKRPIVLDPQSNGPVDGQNH